jgi:hypothetical protein
MKFNAEQWCMVQIGLGQTAVGRSPGDFKKRLKKYLPAV